MRTTSTPKKAVKGADALLVTRHPSVQAFIDKKVEQARESLKGADLSAIRTGKKK